MDPLRRIHSWNWKGQEGKPATVEVYADADEVELFVNGQSVGRQAVGAEKKDIALFETVYEPGTLEAVAYRGGQEIGRDVIRPRRMICRSGRRRTRRRFPLTEAISAMWRSA